MASTFVGTNQNNKNVEAFEYARTLHQARQYKKLGMREENVNFQKLAGYCNLQIYSYTNVQRGECRLSEEELGLKAPVYDCVVC